MFNKLFRLRPKHSGVQLPSKQMAPPSAKGPESQSRLTLNEIEERPEDAAKPTSPHGRISASDWLEEDEAKLTVAHDLLHPDKIGLDVVSSRELMVANRNLINQALEAFTHKKFIPDFDDQILELIRRTAHWMGPLPASKTYHHAGRGGLFTHSIGVAVGALHMSVAKNVHLASSPRDRDADILAWQLVCFIGGLLHDIGKVHTIGNVHALSVQRENEGQGGRFLSSAAPVYDHQWEPMVEGFESWVAGNKVTSYYIDFENAEDMVHREFTVRYVMSLVPRPLLAFIYSSTRMVRQQFEDFIRNPESGSRTPIFQVVQDADHLNVAQSLDPRRRPGTVETTSLILRRFIEFAAESMWNMPTSSFIYANVQKETPSGLRFYGLPFFVASEQSINALLSFIKSRPMLGSSFGDRMGEMVFNALETSQVMGRTIEGILPTQIPDAALQEFVPASKAELLFKAQNVESVLKPVNGKYEDILMTLPVIPIKCLVPPLVMARAPAMAFHGIPFAGDAAVVVPTALNGGVLVPSDQALAHDPEFRASFDKDILTPQEQASLPVLKMAVGADVPKAKPNFGKPKSRKGAKALKTEQMDFGEHTPEIPAHAEQSAVPEQSDVPIASKAATPGPSAAFEKPLEHAEPVDDAGDRAEASSENVEPEPYWLVYARNVLSQGEKLTNIDFWTLVYIYFAENPLKSSDAMTLIERDGIYGFKGEITLPANDAFWMAMSITNVSRVHARQFWPRERLTPNDLTFKGVLRHSNPTKPGQGTNGTPELSFTHEANDLIDGYFHEKGRQK